MNNHLKIAGSITKLLEGQFKIAGMRFGLDPILGFIPGFGDIISFVLSLYLVWIAFTMKLPGEKISEMVRNVLIDLIIGSIPVVGDIGDFFYRANTKNLKILQNFQKNDIIDAEVIE